MKVLVGDSAIDVGPEELPAFTYSISDLSDMGRVRGARSTSMRVPVTNANRRVMGGASAMEDSGAKSQPFAVTDGTGGLYFEGTSVITSRSEDAYTLVALGDNAKWMQAIKDTKLRDFDFGVQHFINTALIRDTWTNEAEPLYFPLVNYGLVGTLASGANVPNEYLRPGVRVKRVLEAVFADAGYAIEAKGSFANLWPKLVTPNTFERIQVAERTLKDNRALFVGVNPTNGSGSDPIPTSPVDDPGSHYIAPGRYGAGLEGTYNIKCDVEASIFGNGQALFILRDYVSGTNVATRVGFAGNNPNVLQVTFTVDFGDIAVTSGMQLGVHVNYVGFGVISLTNFTTEYTLLDVVYQDGIWVTTQACCQDITAQELLSRVVKAQNLVAYTRGQSVELWRYDEFFKPVSDGYLDLTNRTNGVVVKATREQPVAFEFVHKRDSDDKIMASYGGDWADGRIEVAGGVMEEEKVEVSYAATAMGNVLGGLLVPMLVDRRDSAIDVFDREDRMLVADGLRPGSWVQNGDTLDSYPFCYSAFQSLDGTLFGDVERYSSQGTATSYYRNRVARETGVIMEADIYWYDHEVASFDPSIPVKIRDGENYVFCYVQEITQHRFGLGRPSRTKLIPV